jgi:hypothetical protein
MAVKIIHEAGEVQDGTMRELACVAWLAEWRAWSRSSSLPVGGSTVAQIASCTFCAARRDGDFTSNQIINGVSSHGACFIEA